ncbi:SIS domain-containing protein [Georgenia sunbinii]|uniref:SIS domain-containing protein n=1 Tax=Georgenia sunbinii TaxID=3117728 RepID=UPI002F266093
MTDDHSDLLDAARDLIRREAGGVEAVAEQLDDSFLRVVQLLLACRGKVFVTGSGTSGAIARRMAHLLSVCGTPAVFVSAMDALHGTMGVFAKDDVLITISRGGETDELNQLSTRVQQREVPVVALTAKATSTLAGLADVVVIIDSGPEVDPGGVIAMGSTLAGAVWGDALAYVLMRVRGYGWDEVLFTHPAGAVGKITTAPESLAALQPAPGRPEPGSA